MQISYAHYQHNGFHQSSYMESGMPEQEVKMPVNGFLIVDEKET